MDGTVPTPWGTIADSIDDCEPNSSTATNVSQSDVMGPSPVLQQQITPEMVAQGYQPGMGAQTVVVGGQSKGPKRANGPQPSIEGGGRANRWLLPWRTHIAELFRERIH